MHPMVAAANLLPASGTAAVHASFPADIDHLSGPHVVQRADLRMVLKPCSKVAWVPLSWLSLPLANKRSSCSSSRQMSFICV